MTVYYYLDASAWVKQYYEEEGSSLLRNLFQQNLQLACASLGVIEVTATLVRKRRPGQSGVSLLEQKAAELQRDAARFFVIDLSNDIVDDAKTLVWQFGLRGSDSVHLASVLYIHRAYVQPEDKLFLVTSDRELRTAAEQSGLVVIDPEEQERQGTPTP